MLDVLCLCTLPRKDLEERLERAHAAIGVPTAEVLCSTSLIQSAFDGGPLYCLKPLGLCCLVGVC